MQKREINKIVSKIQKKKQMNEFLDSEIFLEQFPESRRNFLLNANTLDDFKKKLKQILNYIANRISVQIVQNVNDFFAIKNTFSSRGSIIFTTDSIDDDSILLKKHMIAFTTTYEMDLTNFVLAGWYELCLNQGITCEIHINQRVIDVFSLKSSESIPIYTPSPDILEPLDFLFENLKPTEILVLITGNALWNLMSNHFQKKTKYSILRDNGIIIIDTVYECILLILNQLNIKTSIKDSNEIGELFFIISEYEMCENFIIEPWRLIF